MCIEQLEKCELNAENIRSESSVATKIGRLSHGNRHIKNKINDEDGSGVKYFS